MKIKIEYGMLPYEFDEPVYNLTIDNIGKVGIYVNGNDETTKDSIVIYPNNKKKLGYSGITKLYFSPIEPEQIGYIDIDTVDHLKPVTHGEVSDGEEIIVNLHGIAEGIVVKNSLGAGSNLLVSPNASINIENAYIVQPNAFLQLEQNIEKVYLSSEGFSMFEVYAYRGNGIIPK